MELLSFCRTIPCCDASCWPRDGDRRSVRGDRATTNCPAFSTRRNTSGSVGGWLSPSPFKDTSVILGCYINSATNFSSKNNLLNLDQIQLRFEIFTIMINNILPFFWQQFNSSTIEIRSLRGKILSQMIFHLLNFGAHVARLTLGKIEMLG